MPSLSDATVTIFWELANNCRHRASAPCKVAEAYILPASYHTDETVKSDLNRLMLLVDETQIPIACQAHARYPYGVAYRSPPPQLS